MKEFLEHLKYVIAYALLVVGVVGLCIAFIGSIK